MEKRICVVTSTRADYGILKPLMEKINQKCILQLVVIGMHLSEKYGLTYKEIENDGFKISKKIFLDLDSDDCKNLVKQMGIEMMELGEIFDDLKPDLLIVLGDRYEILVVAQAATIFRIPIAHLCGGDITEGAYDDCIRHAITKMSHIHFVTNEISKQNVIQMGENPKIVFDFGHVGLEDFSNFVPISKNTLENTLDIKFNKFNFVILYHPETVNGLDKENLEEIIKTLNHYNNNEHSFFMIGSNSDNNNNIINNTFINYGKNNPHVFFFKSLPRNLFLSLVHHCDVFIGNSSSGIYEVPFLEKPTINIGNRQQNRLQPKSVINTESNMEKIIINIEEAKKMNFKNIKKVYLIQDTSSKILDCLLSIKNFDCLLRKTFKQIQFNTE